MSDPDLHWDLESRSIVDLRKCGVYVYAEDESTSILCAAYAIGDGPVKLWTREGDEDNLPYAMKHCRNHIVHNASFERTMLSHIGTPRHAWPAVSIDRWRCTMVMALALSLPASLGNAAAAVGLEQGKDMGGRALMLQMSHPRRPRKGENPNGVYWFEDEDRLQKLYAYCKQDVEAERALEKRLLALRSSEQSLYELDQRINDRGVFVDTSLCDAATKIVGRATMWLNEEIHRVTEGAVKATTNVAQIKCWLRLRGYPTESLGRECIEDMLTQAGLPAPVRRVLELRLEAAKAAVKKIDALVAGRSKDGRAKGLLQFHSAGTGRWAGRRFQPQNIKRPKGTDIDGAIEAVMTGDADYVSATYGEPLAVVGDCLRGMVTAAPGNILYAADFSNIEGRLGAWLGGEQWKLDAFRAFDAGTGHDLYKIMAGKLLGKRPEDVTKDERQGYGKLPELALQYQGGVGAFQKMAVVYGVMFPDERVEEIKVGWRDEHLGIVDCWYALEAAAKAAIRRPGTVHGVGPIAFKKAGSFLFMQLPSGRCIAYPYPCIKDKLMPWGDTKPQVSYMGINSYTQKWEPCFAHGGMLFNNAVQGAARDVEAEAMVRVEAAGYFNILNVHDEVVCETPKDFGSVEEYEELMTTLPAWLTGMPLAAGAWSAERYRK